jgi:hypothetical protein
VIAGAWRVVCEGGAAHEVSARHTPGSYGGEWRADSDGAAAGGSSARTAVLALAAGTGWPVVELVAPGAQTSEERLAQVTADRDYWREQATAAAPCVDGMRAITSLLIPGGTGCIVDPERVVAALRAIIAGRTVAPSDAEIEAHAAAGGSWLVRYRRDETTTTRVGWHPLDATGRPCAWPTGGGP